MKGKLNWGTGLTIAMIAFVGFIVFLFVTSTTNTSDYLEDNDYYEKGLMHQNQIDAMENTKPYKSEIEVKLESPDVLKIQLPPQMDLGEVTAHLYRPSDGNLDKKYTINNILNENNLARLDASELKTGKWRVKLNWKDLADKAYYFEQILIK